MVFFRRLGLSIASLLFSTLLVVFALFISCFMVLDKPPTIKNALRDSGTYEVIITTTLAERNQELSAALPLDNPQVRQAIQTAFPTSYLQATAEYNIDATYDWVHGVTQSPQYKVDVAQPKQVFADKMSQLAAERIKTLPACTKAIEMPATATDVLEMTCVPPGVPADTIIAGVRSQAQESQLFDDIATSTATLEDNQGRSLAERMSFIPDSYRYFVLSLFIIPAVLLLSALGIVCWSMSRRLGLRRLGYTLIGTGLASILLAVLAVWLIGQGARLLGDADSSLLALQSKLLETGRLIGAQLRNWLIGVGAAYMVAGIIALIIVRLKKNKQNAEQNKDLNKSLGYSDTIPSAGTTFGPGDANAKTAASGGESKNSGTNSNRL